MNWYTYVVTLHFPHVSTIEGTGIISKINRRTVAAALRKAGISAGSGRSIIKPHAILDTEEVWTVEDKRTGEVWASVAIDKAEPQQYHARKKK